MAISNVDQCDESFKTQPIKPKNQVSKFGSLMKEFIAIKNISNDKDKFKYAKKLLKNTNPLYASTILATLMNPYTKDNKDKNLPNYLAYYDNVFAGYQAKINRFYEYKVSGSYLIGAGIFICAAACVLSLASFTSLPFLILLVVFFSTVATAIMSAAINYKIQDYFENQWAEVEKTHKFYLSFEQKTDRIIESLIDILYREDLTVQEFVSVLLDCMRVMTDNQENKLIIDKDIYDLVLDKITKLEHTKDVHVGQIYNPFYKEILFKLLEISEFQKIACKDENASSQEVSEDCKPSSEKSSKKIYKQKMYIKTEEKLL